jgi:hypothetical protein
MRLSYPASESVGLLALIGRGFGGLLGFRFDEAFT